MPPLAASTNASELVVAFSLSFVVAVGRGRLFAHWRGLSSGGGSRGRNLDDLLAGRAAPPLVLIRAHGWPAGRPVDWLDRWRVAAHSARHSRNDSIEIDRSIISGGQSRARLFALAGARRDSLARRHNNRHSGRRRRRPSGSSLISKSRRVPPVCGADEEVCLFVPR
jgi:hypothetical protein